MRDKRLIKRNTFKTKETVYTVAGNLQVNYVKMWIFLVGYLYGRVVRDNLAQLQLYYANTQLADYNVHIWFFGGVGRGEILKMFGQRAIEATCALGKFNMVWHEVIINVRKRHWVKIEISSYRSLETIDNEASTRGAVVVNECPASPACVPCCATISMKWAHRSASVVQAILWEWSLSNYCQPLPHLHVQGIQTATFVWILWCLFSPSGLSYSILPSEQSLLTDIWIFHLAPDLISSSDSTPQFSMFPSITLWSTPNTPMFL